MTSERVIRKVGCYLTQLSTFLLHCDSTLYSWSLVLYSVSKALSHLIGVCVTYCIISLLG